MASTAPLNARGTVAVTVGDAEPIEAASFEFPIAVATSGPSDPPGVTVSIDLAWQMSRALRGLAHEMIKGRPNAVLRGDAAVLNPRDAAVTARLAEHQSQRQEMRSAQFREGPAHVIYGDRQTGKTHLAIQWLLDAPADVDRHLLVTHAAVARDLCRQHGTKNVHTFRTFSFETAERHARHRGARIEIGVDDAQAILSDLLRVPSVNLLTITTDEPRSIGEAP